ncbi:DsbA family protein [Staphylococcus chromogenes]|uniref:DsbA family protein n=1 Tax=Staphylococcus chromogenes TaxID=46126 RepID=UPI0028879AD5|nr:thioredoxin domain-containing protein [Staphylococcus chromogenes]MDT0698458.1 thioredoxin domain-containing protein [Staphylococcus chromogenes]
MKSKKTVLMIAFVSLFIFLVIGLSLWFVSKNQTTDIKDVAQLHKDTAQQPYQGNAKNKVTLVEFGDYKCPYCGAFEREIKPQLQKEYIDSGKVELRYVNVLLHGEESMRGTRAALAVNTYAPEAYWSFHRFLYQHQPQSKKAVSEETWLTDDLIKSGLDTLNISSQQKKKIIQAYQSKSDQTLTHAKKDHQLAKKYQVQQVPSLYVNGRHVEDVTDYQQIKKVIDQELEAQK